MAAVYLSELVSANDQFIELPTVMELFDESDILAYITRNVNVNDILDSIDDRDIVTYLESIGYSCKEE